MHIGFDMDGVLMDHTTWKQLLARKMGHELTPAQTASDVLKTILTAEQHDEMQRTLYTDDRYALSPSLMDGARGLLDELRERGIRYTLISRRSVPDLARLLLEKHGLRPQHFTDDNTVFVRSRIQKSEACERLGVTHYIDDQPSVLSELVSVPHRFLLDPHDVFAGEPWRRVSTLDEFRATILAP